MRYAWLRDFCKDQPVIDAIAWLSCCQGNLDDAIDTRMRQYGLFDDNGQIKPSVALPPEKRQADKDRLIVIETLLRLYKQFGNIAGDLVMDAMEDIELEREREG